MAITAEDVSTIPLVQPWKWLPASVDEQKLWAALMTLGKTVKLHPTQKSIHILKPLIDTFTRPGDLVLDPFAGSGSTCVAAHRTGRHYLGIELDTNHHQTAVERLAREEPKAVL